MIIFIITGLIMGIVWLAYDHYFKRDAKWVKKVEEKKFNYSMKKLILKMAQRQLKKWWEDEIGKDEFSDKLSILHIYNNYPKGERELILINRRNLAHNLDAGDNYSMFSYSQIKNAKLRYK